MNVLPMVRRPAAPRLRRSLFRKLTSFKRQSIRFCWDRLATSMSRWCARNGKANTALEFSVFSKTREYDPGLPKQDNRHFYPQLCRDHHLKKTTTLISRATYFDSSSTICSPTSPATKIFTGLKST